MNAPELNNKVTISLYLMIGLVVAAFTLGGTVTKVLSQEGEIEDVRRFAKEYVEQEVGGLRSDWERRNTEVEKRLDKLEQ